MERSDKTIVILVVALPVIFIVYAAVSVFYPLFSTKVGYSVNVRPASEANRSTLAQYNSTQVIGTGTLIAPDPDIGVKLLWKPNSQYLSGFIESLFIIFIGLQVLFIFRALGTPNVSEKVDTYLRRIGYSLFVYYIVNTARGLMVKSQIVSLTNKEFKLNQDFNSGTGIWLSVLFLALALASKKIRSLKEEQELTI